MVLDSVVVVLLAVIFFGFLSDTFLLRLASIFISFLFHLLPIYFYLKLCDRIDRSGIEEWEVCQSTPTTCKVHTFTHLLTCSLANCSYSCLRADVYNAADAVVLYLCCKALMEPGDDWTCNIACGRSGQNFKCIGMWHEDHGCGGTRTGGCNERNDDV